jgi:DNA polymerase-3 subunit alpha
MIVTDSPTNEEAKHGVSFSGGARKTLLDAMAVAGFPAKNGANAYHTSVVKNAKREKLTTEQITECRKHLNAEVEIVKPSVILCLGGAAIRHFYPEAKGGWSEMCGQVIYDKNLDATLVFGLNPQMIFFKPEVEKHLVDVFKIVRDILS